MKMNKIHFLSLTGTYCVIKVTPYSDQRMDNKGGKFLSKNQSFSKKQSITTNNLMRRKKQSENDWRRVPIKLSR